MRRVFAGVKRVLREDGTLWLNLGDSYTSGGRKTHGTRLGHKQETNVGSVLNNLNTQRADGGLPNGNLLGIPWRVALALQADGWVLRSEIIWHKPSGMPESVENRCTKAHEHVFMFSQRGSGYYFDNVAIQEPNVSSRTGGLANKSSSKPFGTGLESTTDHVDDGMKNKRDVWKNRQRGRKAGALCPVSPQAGRTHDFSGYKREGLLWGMRGAL